MVDKIEEMAEYLRALTEEGGSGNRLIDTGGHGWLVFYGEKGKQFIECEAAANAHLTEDHQLDDSQKKMLRAAGFNPPRHKSMRLRRTYNLSQVNREGEIAMQLSGVMQRLYSAEPDRLKLQLHLGDIENIDNPRLRKSMRKVSRVRSHEARMELYREMINATFLMIVENEGSLKPRQLGTLGRFAVFGVFTDVDSLRSFDPRGTAVRKLYGFELFPMLMNMDIGSLKINPEGDIGGELYRNEVQTIAEAVLRFRGPVGSA